MNTPQSETNSPLKNVTQAHRQLLVRAAVAGGLIVALLAGLLLLEKKPAPDDSAQKVRVISNVTNPSDSVNNQSGPSLADDAKEALRKSTEAATALPANMEAASAALAASAQSAVPEDSAGSISDSTLGVPNPKAEAASPSKEESGPRLVIESAPKTKAIPPPPPPATRAATPASPNAPPALSSGYSVQVGVFASYANAEDLHAKLSAAGIPNQIESRVSLGPFKTREQALAAQKKLSKMGLGQGMVLPPKK